MTASFATSDPPSQAYISYANGAGIYQPISTCITSVFLGFLIRIGPYRARAGLAKATWTHGGAVSDITGAVSGLSALRVQESRTPSVCIFLSSRPPVPKSQLFSAAPPLTTRSFCPSKHLRMQFSSLLLPLLALVAFAAAAPIRGPLENHRRSAERFDYPDSKDVKERSVAANRVLTYIDTKNIA